MDNPDKSYAKSSSNGRHYWARLEAKSNTMAEELLHRIGPNEPPSTSRQTFNFARGFAFFLALAIGFATFCLYCNTSTPLNTPEPPRYVISVPKYLTTAVRH